MAVKVSSEWLNACSGCEISILNIGDDSIFLDAETRAVRARGNPRELLRNSTDPAVIEFLTRGAPVSQNDRSFNPIGDSGRQATDHKS